MNPKEPFYYEEIQKMDQWWYRLAILIGPAVIWTLFLLQVVFGIEVDKDPGTEIVLTIVWLLVGIFMPWYLLSSRLITVIASDGIYVRFKPYHFKYQRFLFSDIEKVETMTYRAIRDFGGYGIKFVKNTKIYNVKGNKAIKIFFKNGKSLVIGTQVPDQLDASIRNVFRPKM